MDSGPIGHIVRGGTTFAEYYNVVEEAVRLGISPPRLDPFAQRKRAKG